jgi:hypothetical protein
MNELHKAIRKELRNAGLTVTKRAKARSENVAVDEGYLTEEWPNGTVWLSFVPLYLSNAGSYAPQMSLRQNKEARENGIAKAIALLSSKGFQAEATEGEFAKVTA